ncbi:sulfotransferase family [Fragilaria crotonensis]|nr:sulfotransferase family [Fragilaria crotonensis]
MIKSLKSAAATIAILLCSCVAFTNAIPICSSAYIPVEHDAYIYNNVSNSSPIVIEKYRLRFFPVPKVADTLFLMLLRRMMGLQTWKSLDVDSSDGLVRLSDFSIDKATHMMNSPEFTRAIFLRDPKDRFLSTYLDNVLSNDASIMQSCCLEGESCLHKYHTTAEFATLIQTCNDKHWMPMSSWIDPEFIPKLNFVGHLENAEADARSLLEKVGAWEPFGVTGWGKHGDESIFATKDKLSDLTASHASDSWHLMSKLFTPRIESTLELYYAVDYKIHEFGLELIKIPFSVERSRKAVPIIMFEPDDTIKHHENSSIGTFLKTNDEDEMAPCTVDWNQTKDLEPIDRVLFIGDLTGRLFDEARVLGLLLHWNV